MMLQAINQQSIIFVCRNKIIVRFSLYCLTITETRSAGRCLRAILGGGVATFRYYISDSPGSLSPPTEELLTIQADSATDAVERIRSLEYAPDCWPIGWLHGLVWLSAGGEQRGFESTRLR